MVIEFVKYLWDVGVKGSTNLRFGKCRWDSKCGLKRIYIDEDMCMDCYWNDYVIRYK